MGQYYRIFNTSKKESISPAALGDGVKLLEFGCGGVTTAALAVLLANSNGRGGGDLNAPYKNGKRIECPEIDKISGRWSGDSIVIQGDYAKEGDPSFISESERENFKDISKLCIDALKFDGYFKEILEDSGLLKKKAVNS